ncbi:MAG TPA: HPr kinase/phosphorylase [Caulobacteraceae bacterium]
MSGSQLSSVIRHGGLLALRIDGLWLGVLVEGGSGAGKSDLALRAMGEGLRLVSDDRTVVFVSEGRLFGRAPDALGGLVEARGVGIIAAASVGLAEILLLARCVAAPAAIERHPDFGAQKLLGVGVATIDIGPLEASAPAKLRHCLEHLGRRRQPEYQALLAPP